MNTSRKLLFAAASIASLAIAQTAAAQASGSASASASVTLIEPLKISKIDDINLGTVTRGVGDVTIAAASGAHAAGPATGTGVPVVLASSTSTTTPAHFQITGQASQAISWTGTSTTVAMSGLANPMTLAFSWGATAPTTLPSATYDVYVGGTQTLVAADAAGAHTGTFTVAVSYN